MAGLIGLTAADRLLRRGDRLVHNRASGTWCLARAGLHLLEGDAVALLADKRLALRPAGDQLPGFPADCSQSWARRPRARRPAPARAAAAAT